MIVGQQNANKYGPRLRSIIGAGLTPSNICWITNRQQGKTTTLSKFIAALAGGHRKMLSAPPRARRSNPRADPHPYAGRRLDRRRQPLLRLFDGARPRTGGRKGVQGGHRLAPHDLARRTRRLREDQDCTRQRTHGGQPVVPDRLRPSTDRTAGRSTASETRQGGSTRSQRGRERSRAAVGTTRGPSSSTRLHSQRRTGTTAFSSHLPKSASGASPTVGPARRSRCPCPRSRPRQ